MPLDHELFRPFANHWEAGYQNFEWTTWGDDLLLRPHGAPLWQMWAMLNAAAYGPQLSLPRARCEPLLPVSVKTRHALQGRLLWRVWPLSTDETCLVRSRGSLLRAPGLPTVRFAHPALPDFDRADASEMEVWTQTQQTPDSDLQHARRWQRLSHGQRINEIVAVRGGTWDELVALLRAAFVLWAQPNGPALHPPSGDSFELSLSAMGPVSFLRPWYLCERPIDEALRIIAQHWFLERRAPHDSTYWWRECDEFGDPMDVPQPTFGFSAPSQHQRLEALLLWRDWLRDKWSPQQIESLLTQV